MYTYLFQYSNHLSVISGFRRDVDYICALLGCYAAYSVKSLPTFRDNPSSASSWSINPKKKLFLDFFTSEYGTDTLSRNVCQDLQLHAAKQPRTAQISKWTNISLHSALEFENL